MTSPRTLLAAWNLHPKKRLGQHFLTDPSTARTIVEAARILPGDTVLEIGAGLGALTIPAARIAQKVFAVEIDHDIVRLLRTELLAKDLSSAELVEEDILKVDLEALLGKQGGKMVVLGNLPYSVSSQVLVRLIRSRRHVSRAVLMLQQEMAQRIMALPGSKDYGRLTVILGYCAEIRRVVSVGSCLFFPQPKVDSDVLEIRFRDAPEWPAEDENFFFSVVKAGFGKRRKTLKNALSTSELPVARDTVEKTLHALGIDPARRAETLTVQEFVKLSNGLGG